MGNGAHLLVRQLGPLPYAGAGLRASTYSGEDRGGLRGWGFGGPWGGDGWPSLENDGVWQCRLDREGSRGKRSGGGALKQREMV